MRLAGALSVFMGMGYPERNKDEIRVPTTVFSDQPSEDGTTKTASATVVLNLVDGRWQVTGYVRSTGR